MFLAILLLEERDLKWICVFDYKLKFYLRCVLGLMLFRLSLIPLYFHFIIKKVDSK